MPATTETILGILSLIVWTIIILVFVEYIFLAMSLDLHGEGGTLILKRILDGLLPSGNRKAVFGVLALAGVALLIGDGVITPSISILSAVEGVVFIPGFEHISQWTLIGGAMVIAFALFAIQPLGTDRVAGGFGPVMVIWFFALSLSGVVSISENPVVLKALNPVYAVSFFYHHGFAGFLILSQVILCATGSEALYADMGHLGKKPIIKAWNVVFVALVLNYLGQGAFLLSHPEAKNLLFAMVNGHFPGLYIPFLILTIMATVIASQALISGVFSIVYQGINSGVFPRMRVSFTSKDLKSQIYIGAVNFGLMAAVILMLAIFKRSDKLAVAYGLAVTGTMCITGVIMTLIFKRRNAYFRMIVAVIVTAVDFAFFIATLSKLEEGGYWSLIIASIPFIMMILWTRGQKKIYTSMKSLPAETFLPGYTQIYEKGHNIPGIALFFIGNPKMISPYIIHSIVRHGIIYQRNILFTVNRTDFPYGIEMKHNENYGKGLELFEVIAGYREDLDIGKILQAYGIDPKAIFYGIEDITTRNAVWRAFAVLKKLAPTFVKYYRIPGTKLIGVVYRVEI
jgi:KUP system potassium uptake protein